MASNLLAIASSGVRAARAGLDVSAQNIANVGTAGYVRRSVDLAEVAGGGIFGRTGDVSLSGVRVAGIARHADAFRSAEVRRTGSDSARAAAELTAYQDVETALDQAQVLPALTSFEAGLTQLSADPIDPALRSAALANAGTLTRSFNIAAQGLDSVAAGLQVQADDGTAQVNLLASELGRVNLQLARTAASSSDQANLLDQRDGLLGKLAQYTGVSASIAANQTVDVRISGALLVSGSLAAPLALIRASDGTISFTLGAAPVALSAGSLAGLAQGLVTARETHDRLDSLANDLSAAVNTAQTGGSALGGTAGTALFGGSGAAGLTVTLASGAGLATAPAGSPAGSRDPGNLTALRNALDNSGIAARTDGLLFDISAATQGRRVTSGALVTIAATARGALDSQAGVNLDQEAVNLVRYQQVFQACGKAIQTASAIFDTLLAIR